MVKAKHFLAYMQQRGIINFNLAQEYCQVYGDKYILEKKEILFALKQLDVNRKNLIKALEQCAIIAIESGGHLITAYQKSSFKGYKK